MVYKDLSGRQRVVGALLAAISCCAFIACFNDIAQSAEPDSAKEMLQELHRFRQMGTMLMIAAHPDDENTQLLTYAARGPGYRTAYLSVTRGDGGQNLLGSDFGSDLGVIRTQELLAARRLDGAKQFFTRAIDFGFCKDVNEALAIWDHPVVLGDVVRVIRTFRPDVIVTRFSPKPSGTHGHHTASAVLGVEAFKLAGDPNAYPEQLKELSVWQPKRILQNGGGGRGGPAAPVSGSVSIDIGGIDPVLGIPFGDIANQSRAMHKSQGFGGFGGRGGGGGPRMEAFVLLDGEPIEKDIMDGVDTTWNRVAGGGDVDSLVDVAIKQFDSGDLAANLPRLLAIRKKVAALKSELIVQEKLADLDKIIKECVGLEVKTTVPAAVAIPGEAIELTHQVTMQSDIPVRWIGMKYPAGRSAENSDSRDGRFADPVSVQKQSVVRTAKEKIDAGAQVSQAYWLREPANIGTNQVSDQSLIGKPENDPPFPVKFVFEIEGQSFEFADEPVRLVSNSEGKEVAQRLEIVGPVAIKFPKEVRLFAPGSSQSIEVDLTANESNAKGTLQIDAPKDWRVQPQSVEFQLAESGESKRFQFQVTAPDRIADATLGASVKSQGGSFNRGLVSINYSHIPIQVLQPLATCKAVSLDINTKGQKVGYISGAGDSVAEAIAEMGYAVTFLSEEELTEDKLRELDAVVIGVRALNVRKELVERMPVLFKYVEQGGNVIVQYNRPDNIPQDKLAPYSLHISSNRITDENSAVRFLAPDHPVLNTPNKITADDFTGWVQERGIYFPDQWDKAFTPILAASDPNESPLEGGLLVAKHGKGHFVYTGLVWFRQLPAGVPGAYRLFANLLSLGK